MSLRHLFGFLIATCLLTTPMQEASATLIRIEPDDYAAGTDLSNLFPGVSLATYSNVNRDGYFDFLPVTVGHDTECDQGIRNCKAVTGSNYLVGPGFVSGAWSFPTNCFTDSEVRNGNAPCGTEIEWPYAANFLVLSFTDPTDFVELTAAWLYDHMIARAYDANFNLVGFTQGSFGMECQGENAFREYCTNRVSLISQVPQISYVVAGSWAGIAHLDTITFNRNVPEPGTLALFGISLAALGLARRRKHRG